MPISNDTNTEQTTTTTANTEPTTRPTSNKVDLGDATLFAATMGLYALSSGTAALAPLAGLLIKKGMQLYMTKQDSNTALEVATNDPEEEEEVVTNDTQEEEEVVPNDTAEEIEQTLSPEMIAYQNASTYLNTIKEMLINKKMLDALRPNKKLNPHRRIYPSNESWKNLFAKTSTVVADAEPFGCRKFAYGWSKGLETLRPTATYDLLYNFFVKDFKILSDAEFKTFQAQARTFEEEAFEEQLTEKLKQWRQECSAQIETLQSQIDNANASQASSTEYRRNSIEIDSHSASTGSSNDDQDGPVQGATTANTAHINAGLFATDHSPQTSDHESDHENDNASDNDEPEIDTDNPVVEATI